MCVTKKFYKHQTIWMNKSNELNSKTEDTERTETETSHDLLSPIRKCGLSRHSRRNSMSNVDDRWGRYPESNWDEKRDLTPKKSQRTLQNNVKESIVELTSVKKEEKHENNEAQEQPQACHSEENSVSGQSSLETFRGNMAATRNMKTLDRWNSEVSHNLNNMSSHSRMRCHEGRSVDEIWPRHFSSSEDEDNKCISNSIIDNKEKCKKKYNRSRSLDALETNIDQTFPFIGMIIQFDNLDTTDVPTNKTPLVNKKEFRWSPSMPSPASNNSSLTLPPRRRSSRVLLSTAESLNFSRMH